MTELLLWIVIGMLAGATSVFRLWWRRRHAESWYQVQGNVEQARVSGWNAVSDVGVPRENLTVELLYSYKVNGEWYSGSVRHAFSDENDAHRFADQYRGKPVLVRYDPSKPERSILWASNNAL